MKPSEQVFKVFRELWFDEMDEAAERARSMTVPFYTQLRFLEFAGLEGPQIW